MPGQPVPEWPLNATGRERIYDGYPDLSLDLVESRTFDGRLQLLEFAPTVLDGPPARPHRNGKLILRGRLRRLSPRGPSSGRARRRRSFRNRTRGGLRPEDR